MLTSLMIRLFAGMSIACIALNSIILNNHNFQLVRWLLNPLNDQRNALTNANAHGA